jgi:peptidoglycan-N-acetylglucosamine deacetylase
MLASVSVDLDPIGCYYRIHALGAAPPDLSDVILRRALPRYLEILSRHQVRATFFVVASDLQTTAGRALVRDIAAAGHEVGNHSYSHPYDMARLPRARVREEIRRAHDDIEAVTGRKVDGFRAPGYDVSADMLDELMALGYGYDSSIFPAPAYYALKAGMMAALRLVGRPSGAVLTNPRALLAPADPYRPDPRAPWRRGQATLVELPIAVTPGWRLPAIGTNLLLLPAGLRRRWLDAMERRPFFNFELHGIDLIDADEDGIPSALVARQPDLRASLVAKRRAFEAILDRLKRGYEVVPLCDAARRVQREG